MGESLIKWIFQPRSINTGLEKIRFTNIFLPARRVAGGCVSNSEVINYGGSCGKVSLDSDGASQLRSELQFLSQPVARIVSDDNNRIQFLRSEWNNKVLVYVSWTFISPPLQKEARLSSSFQFSVVNSLPFPFAFEFAFASHVWTSLQNLPWNDILIITELNTFSTENWQCFLYDEPFCLHFIKNDKWNKRSAFWDSCSHW